MIMALAPSKAPNPTISDVNDPRYTPLNQFNRAIGARALIAELGAVSGNNIAEHLYVEDNIALGDALLKVQPGDIAYMGNRVGMVLQVLEALDTNNYTSLVAIKVHEDMRYLPLDYKSDPESFGYDDSLAKVGRTVTYILGNAKNNVDFSSIVVGGKNFQPGSYSFYTGQIQVIKQKTYNPQTWTNTARALLAYQEKYKPSPKAEFVSQSLNFDADKQLTISVINDFKEVAPFIDRDATTAEIKSYLDGLDPLVPAELELFNKIAQALNAQ
jgi:hypothetical protein